MPPGSKEALVDLNLVIVVLYLVAMLGFGFWGRSRTQNSSDYLVAGRRLGFFACARSSGRARVWSPPIVMSEVPSSTN